MAQILPLVRQPVHATHEPGTRGPSRPCVSGEVVCLPAPPPPPRPTEWHGDVNVWWCESVVV